MKPLSIDVIALIPEGWGLCVSCEALFGQAGLGKAPADRGLEDMPSELNQEFQRLSDLVLDLARQYGNQINITLFDPRSFQGMVKSIRHGVRRYPTFIIAGKQRVVGLDSQRIQHLIELFL